MSFPYSSLGSGTRIALFGRSGSGKSYLGKWMILRSTSMRWIVLDTKHDPIFDDWHIVTGLPSARQMTEAWGRHANVVVRPAPDENNDAILDLWLAMLHDAFTRFGILIDETYQVAYGTRAGPGFTGLVTRGRVRGQTVIMGSQRPAWVPRYVFSEAVGYCIMSLNLKGDRERVAEMVGDRWYRDVMAPMQRRQWLYYDVDNDRLLKMSPVTIIDVPVVMTDEEHRKLTA